MSLMLIRIIKLLLDNKYTYTLTDKSIKVIKALANIPIINYTLFSMCIALCIYYHFSFVGS
jgi:energy-converting hydrogenase Eha subunit B